MAFNVGTPFFILLALVALVSCKQSEPEKPVVKVTVTTVTLEHYHTSTEYVGRLEAVNDTDIQAQVSGYLKSANFIEGDLVKAGDLLFVIDPSTYQAELSAASAKVAQARALLEEARLNYNRGKKLVKGGAISRSEMDKLTAKLHSTEADVKSSLANEQAAAINLSRTKITAPFEGRVGRKKLSIGDLVAPNSTAPLTTLVSIDPVYATFQVNAKIYSRLSERNRQAIAGGGKPQRFTAKLRLSSDHIYPEVGKFDFVSNRIDADTDSIMIRASFPNKDGVLRPGQYVRVIVEAEAESDVLTVPQTAIVTTQEGEFIYLVDAEKNVQIVPVETRENIGKNVIVVSDQVKEGQYVIVAGMQKVKSGQEVESTLDMPSENTTSD